MNYQQQILNTPFSSKGKKILLLGILLFTFCCTTSAQHKLERINGLPGSRCYSVVQDSAGFMWFSTDKGLVRYDGESLKIFSKDIATHPILGSDNIRYIVNGKK